MNSGKSVPWLCPVEGFSGTALPPRLNTWHSFINTTMHIHGGGASVWLSCLHITLKNTKMTAWIPPARGCSSESSSKADPSNIWTFFFINSYLSNCGGTTTLRSRWRTLEMWRKRIQNMWSGAFNASDSLPSLTLGSASRFSPRFLTDNTFYTLLKTHLKLHFCNFFVDLKTKCELMIYWQC